MKPPRTRSLAANRNRQTDPISGAEAIDRILRHVEGARYSRETAAALIEITTFSGRREESQRLRVQGAGTRHSITVTSVSADGDLEEILSEIVEEADEPNFVLEEVLLSASKLELVSVRRRPGKTFGPRMFFRVRITARDWERRIRVEAIGSDHFDINSRGGRRRPHTRPVSSRSALKPQRRVAAKIKRTKPPAKRQATHKR